MPATEKTSYDQKRLHKIFAVTGVLMLLGTILMFAADHAREWKPVQRTADRIEIKLTEWRQSQLRTEEAQQEQQRMQQELEAARREPIDQELLGKFQREVERAREAGVLDEPKLEGLEQQAAELEQAEGEQAKNQRNQILRRLRDVVRQVRFKEDTLLGERKFKAAERDAAVADLGLMVRDERPEEEQERQQEEIDELQEAVERLSEQRKTATAHRKSLQSVLAQITEAEDEAADALDKSQTELRLLQTAQEERRSTFFNWYGPMPVPGKKWLELPILDAFNSPREIENLWSDGLEIQYGSFGKVRRFDRCTTCHQLIQKTQPGTADQPAYPQERLVNLVLSPPDPEQVQQRLEQSAEATERETLTSQLHDLYGVQFAAEGLLDENDVTVQAVQPQSLAARAEVDDPAEQTAARSADAIRSELLQPSPPEEESEDRGLQVGDVIVDINRDGNPIYDANRVRFRLLDAARSGEPLVLTVRRGMPHPYASHPRLDLFVGSLSPHKLSDFACTICHEGQGSATSFKWASHSPDTMRQRQDWMRDHDWFDNPHWIYPMYPKRFIESTCLKCHHDVTELEASPEHPEPPAPKVTRGFKLVREYGCHGCHEINGYEGSQRIGPDLRLEPNVFAAAQQLKVDPGYETLSEQQREWAEQLIDHPERDEVRQRLHELLVSDSESEQPEFTDDTHAHLTPLFADADQLGQLRKPGPSLRFVGHKLDDQFLYDWIREPQHFRPDTRMPQFFGLHGHLGAEGRALAEQYEPVEILGIVNYLHDRTQPFEFLPPVEDAEPASAERGKVLFETRGCLACHTHEDFPEAEAYRKEGEIVQGPDLSGIGDKLDAHPDGRQWLYTWIKEPSRYHVRTVMPDLFLEPIEDESGQLTDPAADIATFLMSSSVDWEAKEGTPSSATDVDEAALDQFVLENLEDAFSRARAEEFLASGIPPEYRGELKGAEVELINDGAELSTEQKLLYVGSKSLTKYGCYGCHDIPGFEDAKPIGTALADWGRKDPSKLAFEHITHYVEKGAHGGGHGGGHAAQGDEQAEHGADAGEADELPEYYLNQLESGHRIGFIYQKLREPRSYDYHKTANKNYNEWLRMPQFPFSFEDREAVITFVLGLVAEPPSDEYVYGPDPRMEAIIAGRQAIEKYNCGGCHMLEPQQWEIAFDPEDPMAKEQPAVQTYPFLKTHFPPETLEESQEVDRSGLVHATLSGMPALDENGKPTVFDYEGFPLLDDEQYKPSELEFPFDLWEPTVLSGHVYEVGVQPLNVPAEQIKKKRSTDGGFLAKYLLPRVVAREKEANPQAKGNEAWGWLPPPLVGQGSKVQTGWLHDFLLNPYPIRPASVLRMPRFNMSSEEASDIVNYFAAKDDAEYPYKYSDRRQSTHLAEAESRYQQVLQEAGAEEADERSRFEDAMKIVVSSDYCVQCHVVGDFDPDTSDTAKAPDLAQVYERFRPEYLRDWVANPKSILPYTSMPVNIPYNPDAPNLGGVNQDLYHGTSVEQLNGLVDLLMNFDAYAKRRSLITPLVKQATEEEEAEEPATTSSGGG